MRYDLVMQLVRFSSITFYAFHRIVRPSNRIDPVRTIFDLDVVELCLDAIDLSALFQILFVSTDTLNLYPIYLIYLSNISLMIWILSLCVRICSLYLIHLPTSTYIWRLLLKKTPNYYQ